MVKEVDERLRKLELLRQAGINPYPYKFNQNAHSEEIKQSFSKFKGKKVNVAGRIMRFRNMGKLAFADLKDGEGNIQIMFRKNDLKNKYTILNYLNLADFIGVRGEVVKSKTGEITILASNVELLTKTINPLPSDWHGLKDKELRYRHRHLDLITNPKSHKTFIIRSKINELIREFLTKKDFLEVETPIIQPVYGGAAAEPFTSKLNALNMKVYMRISNELYLKRLIIGGYEKVFEFSRDFRNEGVDRTHNPEFTQVEAYASYWDYNDMMKLLEQLYEFIAKKLYKTTKVTYQGKTVDFKAPWKRMTMYEALKKIGGVDIEKTSDAALKSLLRKHNVDFKAKDFVRGFAISDLFEELCEDKLVQPTFITDMPKETSPLCKIHRSNPDLIERFEPYVCGMEIGNAYSELNDPLEQRRQFEFQQHQAKSGDKEAHPMDVDFIEALSHGMPPTGGIGFAIDRMVMLFTDSASIRDVLLFPFMRPQ
jgi:lysyl-tRNA synthetase, class II